MYITSSTLQERFPEGIKGVIFDCDGVMFDTWESNMYFYNLILERIGLPPMTRSQEQFVHMATVVQSLEHIIPATHMDRMQEARKSVCYTKEIMPKMVMEDGLRELLEALRALGVRLGVHTNRTNTMELVLDRFDLTSFFDQVMTASKVVGKPNPEGVHRILGAWGVAAEQVVFIGDTSADQRAAMSAGVDFWAYRNEHLHANQHVNDFWGLRSAFLQWKGWPA